MKIAVGLFIAVLLIGCSGEKPAAPAAPTQTAAPADPLLAPPYERNNLLNMARGAAVVDRTAELTFDNASIHVIDGEKQTSWVSPPFDTEQTLIFSLGTNARVTRVGAHALHPGNPMESLLVEGSIDGKRFTSLATINIARSADPQWATVAPVEVRYLRISPRVSKGQRFAQLNALMAEGEPVGSISAPAIAGCWSVNEMNAAFAQKGAHLTGAIANLHLVGGVDGNVLRFIWTRGPEYGYAAMTMTPDSTRWSGIRWHEDVTIPGFGVTWFAERAACSASLIKDTEVVGDFFGKARRYPAYGLRFGADNTLDAAASEPALAVLAEMIKTRPQSRLIAHEFREQDATKAKQITEKRLQSLRAALKTLGVPEVPSVAMGRENPRVPLHTAIAETMYSVVELEALP